ncbi:MAG: bifunctional glutamate N-acetyltransferase/amino-acid acetyltransferase ArgJ [Halioglobus sp.]|nr:bifunctional glutamate N-acetyltransferase/amino-acid acetyltransferase ArgJ [Halioglobus sp.]
MAVGSDTLATLRAVPGVRLATVSAGIKTPGRKDLVLIEAAANTNCAAVFTRNLFCAAPVTVAREKLQANAHQPRYLLVNTGNANAGTGAAGIAASRACSAAVAAVAGVDADCVLPFSTGVIGEPLPVAKLEQAIPAAFAALSEDGWLAAAQGILTTDTRPKAHSVSFTCDDREYVVTGIAKGAGMIRPNMATMLAYIATDAAVEQVLLQDMLGELTDLSFNRITVDGDTSTNDACVLLATGQAGNSPVRDRGSKLYQALRDAVEETCIVLAQGIVRDGEGASKFVTVQVNGGRTEAECLDVAFTIAHSPLVKTALFASDPNWGRLLAAIGRADVPDLQVERVALYLNDVLIAEGGCRAQSYTEAQGVAAMAPEEIVIRVELDRGEAAAAVWTTDFSYDYVRINAEYRS